VTIDGSDSCIMEHGFEHLRGLSELEKMKLVNNKYLTDDSMESLAIITKNKLRWLHLGSNGNISDQGLMYLSKMKKLEYLKLENLQELRKPKEVLKDLETCLPNCQIEFPPHTNSDDESEIT